MPGNPIRPEDEPGVATITYVQDTPSGMWVITASGPFSDKTKARAYADWLLEDNERVTVN